MLIYIPTSNSSSPPSTQCPVPNNQHQIYDIDLADSSPQTSRTPTNQTPYQPDQPHLISNQSSTTMSP